MRATRFDAQLYADGARLAGAEVEAFEPLEHGRLVAANLTGRVGYPPARCAAGPRERAAVALRPRTKK